MSAIAVPFPSASPPPADLPSLIRLTVADYHEMGESGILGPEDRVELLDGYLVNKPMQTSPHGSTVQRVTEDLVKLVPSGWRVRIQLPITLSESEPEPDAAICQGDRRTFDARHPSGSEIAIVIEVADSSLATDRAFKGPIYARAGIPRYWIVNIPDRSIEVYTGASGPAEAPAYSHRADYSAAQSVPLVLEGRTIAEIPVADLLP